MSDRECPQCGIKDSDRKPRYRIKVLPVPNGTLDDKFAEKVYGNLYCPICRHIWSEELEVSHE